MCIAVGEKEEVKCNGNGKIVENCGIGLKERKDSESGRDEEEKMTEEKRRIALAGSFT